MKLLRVRLAERRWRRNNAAARARGCPCGGPAEVVKEDHDTVGDIPHQWWTCRDCAGAEAFSNGRPMWGHPTQCRECGFLSSAAKIGQEPHTYFCYHRELPED